MGKREIKLPALVGQENRSDVHLICDSLSDFVDHAQALGIGHRYRASSWSGDQSFDDATRLARSGDLSRVARSDEYMSKLEDLTGFERKAFQTVNAMTGGAPNVGAFLSGNPINMRQRRRVSTERAPLNIVADVVSSAGIDAADVERRGAAILALVRVLSAIQPVNLWAVAAARPNGTRQTYSSGAIAIRMDTSPLDLARAAHVFGSAAFARSVCYGSIYALCGDGANGGLGWAFGSVDTYRENAHAYWQRVLGQDELLFLAPPFVTDATIKEPEKFIREMVAKYGQDAAE